MPNAPIIWMRSDIFFHNSQRSGFLRKGEYAFTLTSDGQSGRSYYDSYLENFLIPVYEAKSDGVAIARVWKNDMEHTKEEYKKVSEVKGVLIRSTQDGLIVSLERPIYLAYWDTNFEKLNNCKVLEKGIVRVSEDGVSWKNMVDELPTGQISVLGQLPTDDRLFYSFLGQRAKKVEIKLVPANSCVRYLKNLKVFELPDYK